MNSINSISIKALRSPIDNSSDSLIRFMRGDDLNFRVAIFSDEDTLESLDDILSLRFEIYDIGNYQSPSPRTFSRLILKSIGAQELNSSLSLDDWNNGESQHATFNLSAEESSIEYGEKWLKISAEVETDKFVTVSAGWIEVEENASAYPDTIITDVEAWTSEAQEYAQTAQSAAQEVLELKEDLTEISTQLESAIEDISTASEQASIATESATSAIESATSAIESAQAAAESATQAAASVEAVIEAIETVDGTNIVTISGAQTITGKKVFSSPVSIGTTNTISGTNTLVVGNNCTNNPSSGGNSIIAGTQNTNTGIQGIVCGYQVQNSGNDSLVTGSGTVNTANDSILGGSSNNNSAKNSLVIGDSNTNTGQQSFISGYDNTVSSDNSAAIGSGNSVAGTHSVVFGYNNTINTNSPYCFIAGENNEIDIEFDYYGGAAFGIYNKISSYGGASLVAGERNEITGTGSFAIGWNNKVSGNSAAAFGDCNQDLDENGEAYKFTIGDGEDEDNRSNALSLDASNNFKVKGDIENGTGDKLSEKANTTALSSYATTSAMTTALALKSDTSTTYTKTEVDTALALKADTSALSSYATTSAMTTALALKSDTSTTYTKTEVDTALALKSDTSTTYTKTEVDTALSTKADTSALSSYATTSALSTLDSSAVKLTGTQTIAGTKTFSSNPRISKSDPGITTTHSDFVKGESRTDNLHYRLDVMKDANGNSLGAFYGYADSNNVNYFLFRQYLDDADSSAYKDGLKLICNQDGTTYAQLASTPSLGDNSKKVATTAYVDTTVATKADTELSNLSNDAKALCSYFAMPSNSVVDISIPATGTTLTNNYGDGYVCLYAATTEVGQNIHLASSGDNNNSGAYVRSRVVSPLANDTLAAWIPVAKGSKFFIGYTMPTTSVSTLRLIYTNGAEASI